MLIEQNRSSEKEQFIGRTTLECARWIIGNNPQIQEVAFRHYREKVTGKRIALTREEFLEGSRVEEIISQLHFDWNLSLSSMVVDADKKIWHLPMMDLSPRASSENLTKIVKKLHELIIPDFGNGFLLETGRSYHFLGEKLLGRRGQLKFMGACLLAEIAADAEEQKQGIKREPLASHKYIGHSLYEGMEGSGLRITANGAKNFLPRIVKVI